MSEAVRHLVPSSTSVYIVVPFWPALLAKQNYKKTPQNLTVRKVIAGKLYLNTSPCTLPEEFWLLKSISCPHKNITLLSYFYFLIL